MFCKQIHCCKKKKKNFTLPKQFVNKQYLLWLHKYNYTPHPHVTLNNKKYFIYSVTYQKSETRNHNPHYRTKHNKKSNIQTVPPINFRSVLIYNVETNNHTKIVRAMVPTYLFEKNIESNNLPTTQRDLFLQQNIGLDYLGKTYQKRRI